MKKEFTLYKGALIEKLCSGESKTKFKIKYKKGFVDSCGQSTSFAPSMEDAKQKIDDCQENN